MLRRMSISVMSAALMAGVLSTGPFSAGAFSLEATSASTAHATQSRPAVARRAGWAPVAGVAFNNPVGKTRTALVHRVINAIKHTPTGQTIRIASYSFDRKDVADALLRAHRRGVHVQMVLNDNWTSTQTLRLQRKLGHGLRAESSVRVCHQSCRGGPGNLHMKVYAFSKTGLVNDVVMTGSANMTDRAVSLQWNDLFTVIGNVGLYNTYVNVFNQLKADRPVRPRRVYYNSGAFDATFYRVKPNATVTSLPMLARLPGPAQDPVMQRLQTVNCNTSVGFGDAHRHTILRIMMYGWQGKRGIWLANEVAQLERRGCNIKATLSLAGGNVVKILGRAHIPIQSTDWKYLSDGTVDFYDHMKTLTVNGTIDGAATRSTWTGSENWSGMSFRNDELILQINQTRTYDLYLRKFNTMWRSHDSHSFGLHPVGKP